MKNGQGKLVWINGEEYQGYFKDDEMSGYGKFSLKEGAIYVGFM
jgi:hypothetical protein